MALSGLFKPPEGAIVEAIWRCKRGHDQLAKYTLDGNVVETTDFRVVEAGGAAHSICLWCIMEDYEMERVEYKDG